MSRFLKSDMHLHSRRDGAYSTEAFISTLNSSNLDVACITDHNIIDISLFERINSNLLSNFSGFEINLHIEKQTFEQRQLIQGRTQYFHAIVWINMVSAEKSMDIIKYLFSEFGMSSESKKENKVKFENIDDFYNDCNGVSVPLEKFIEEFKSIPYYFIPHENKSTSSKNGRSISDYLPSGPKNCNITNDEFKTELLKYNNVAIEGKGSTNAKNQPKENNGIIKHLVTVEKVPLANFRFSDAMNLEDIGKKYNWINFDGTFEGMILPFSDSSSRIVTENLSENPQLNYERYLEKISFSIKCKDDNSENNFVNEKEYEIKFEPGYNAIIGSRGSGKSLLANILGDKQDPEKNLEIDKVNFYKKNVALPTTNFKSLFIGQSYFQTIFNNSESQDFSSIPHVKKISDNLKKEHQAVVQNNLSKILSLFDYFENKLLEHIRIYKKTPKYSFTKKMINKDLLNFDTPSDVYSILKDYLKTFNSELDVVEKLLVTRKNYSSSAIFSEFDDCLSNDLSTSNDIIIKCLEDTKKHIKSNLTNLNQLKRKFCYVGKKKELAKELKSIIENYNLKIDANAADTKQNYEYVAHFYDKTYQLKCIYFQIMKLMNELYAGLLFCSNDHIDVPAFKDDTMDIIGKISYLISVKYNLEFNSFTEVLDNSISGNFNNFLHSILFNDVSEVKLKKTFMRAKSLNKDTYVKVAFSKARESIKSLGSEYDVLFSKDGKDFINDMSPGQRAQSLLDIIFNKEIDRGIDYIVIDQPEDNLDNLTITEDLVKKIRRIKKEVQLFVVSHSAPVVINADADKIIVASNDGEIKYNSGEMRDEKIKNEIINLLDGGKYNMNVRYLKYEIDRKDVQ